MHIRLYLTLFLQSAHQNFVFKLKSQQAHTQKKKKEKNYCCPKNSGERNRKEYTKLYGLDFDLKEEQLREG